MNLPTNTKPLIQGALIGAIAATIIGFSWGGWVTGGTADKQVATASHDATVAALATICVDRFRTLTVLNEPFIPELGKRYQDFVAKIRREHPEYFDQNRSDRLTLGPEPK